MEQTPAEKEQIARKEEAHKKEEASLPPVFKDPTLDLTEEQLIDIKTKPIAELFGIPQSRDNREALQTLYKWVLSEKGSDGRSDFVEAIEGLTTKLGIPTVSAQSFHQLMNWVRADLSEKEARKEKQLYEQ